MVLSASTRGRSSVLSILQTDSLRAVKLYAKADSFYNKNQLDSSLLYLNKALPLFAKLGKQSSYSSLLTFRGGIYRTLGSYAKALSDFYSALEICHKLGERYNEANVLNNIGAIYRLRGNYPTALDYYFKALRIFREINSQEGQADVLNNIGIVHLSQKLFDKALTYYKKSLRIEQLLNNQYGIGISHLNMGEVYRKTNQYDKAIDHYLKALVYITAENDLDAIGTIYNEIAGINIDRGRIDEVAKYLRLAKETFIHLQSNYRLAECELNFCKYFLKKGEFPKAISACKQALTLAKKSKALDLISLAHKQLSDIYNRTGNVSQSYHHYKRYIATRDSIFNEENTRKSIQAEMLYQFERKQEKTRIEQAKLEAQYKERSQREATVRKFLILIILLASAFIVLSVYALLRIKKSNRELKEHQNEIQEKNEELLQQQEEILAQRDEIERKNYILEQSQHIIEDKNQRMVSSIEYAQTIQLALLPKSSLLSPLFDEYFIVYLPKDIVSGDFYWVSQNESSIFIAVMDCTGHGVPGSFMSLIGNTLLNKIVNEWEITNPADVIEMLNTELRKALKQDHSDTKLHASIDLAFVRIDKTEKKGVFCGAGRPLIIIQNGELQKIKGNIRSAGGFQPALKKPFTNTEFSVDRQTVLYLFSDGYGDQLGANRKKFGQSKLVELLHKIHHQPMHQQKEILLNMLENHMQGTEQIDDICIFGIKVAL